MTDEQKAEHARASSMFRAQSPGNLVCVIDQIESIDDPMHTHPFDECMNYRHSHLDQSGQAIGDQDPWTYWTPADLFEWPQPPPVPPVGPVGWTVIAEMAGGVIPANSWSQGWTGYSWVTLLGPSRFSTIPKGKLPTQLRLTFALDCTMDFCWIGPLVQGHPTIAQALYMVKFGGNQHVTVNIAGGYRVTSDPIPIGFNFDNGIEIAGHISAADPVFGSAYIGIKSNETDWYSAWIAGDYSTQLDKTYGWTPAQVAAYTVTKIEGYFPE